MVPPSFLRIVLLLYPPSVRRVHEHEICADLCDAWHENGTLPARAALTRRLVVDALSSWMRLSRPSPKLKYRVAAGLMDVRVAVKGFRSNSLSVFGAILMCSVGISLATTMFALSDPFLLRQLPYARPEQLALIEIDPIAALDQTREAPLLSDWQERTDLFVGLAAYTRHGTLRVRWQERTSVLEAFAVSANFFQVLGGVASLGVLPPETPSTFGDEVWLTERVTRGPFGAADLTHRLLPLQEAGVLSVRDVLPSSFLVPAQSERRPVDALVELAPGRIIERRQLGTSGFSSKSLTMVGRLRDRITPSQVEAALNGSGTVQVRVKSLETAMKQSQRPLALGALVAGVLVLAVCAANALGMALTRGLSRVHHLATMETLGAGRARVARVLFAEAAFVSALGLAGALMAVPVLLDTISAVVPRNFIALGPIGISWRAAGFAGLAGVVVCVVWWGGALLAWRRGGRAGLREAVARDRHMLRVVRFGLITSQVAATLVLLAGAGLLARSYLTLVGQDTGMDGDVLAVSASYAPELAGARLRDTIERTTAEFRRRPGVRNAAAVVGQMADEFSVSGLIVVGRPWPVERLWVSSDYFETAGMSFVEGGPSLPARPGAVVNEILVSRLLAESTKVGDMLRVGDSLMPIVGIVADGRRRALDEVSGPAAFLPLDDGMSGGMQVTYLIAGADVETATWESIIQRGASGTVIVDGATLRARLARTIQDRSFVTLVVSLFAAATIAVTAAGLIGVVGYVVARRTREVGIRVALGAPRRSVVWLVMRDALAATLSGVGIGIVCARLLSGLLTSFVYGVSPDDYPTLAVVTAGLLVFAALAAFLPASRAGRLSPTVALREE